jgi:RNA polymerase subunit RPABC4/transcription elongation factor Spt4
VSHDFPQSAPSYGNQVIRRPLTFEELEIGLKSYKKYQNTLRAFGIISLLLAIVTFYLYWEYIIDWSISLSLNIVTLIFGLISIWLAINSISIRKKLDKALSDGSGIEVLAPAYRNNSMNMGPLMKGNIPSWNIGPVILMATDEVNAAIHEGMQVRVLCIPLLKAAISINGVVLRNIAPVLCSPNLEGMAVTEPQPPSQGYQPVQQYSHNAQYPLPPPLTGPPTRPPQPACPNCHNPASPDSAVCPYCSAQLISKFLCGNCNAELPPGAAACPTCGSPRY